MCIYSVCICAFLWNACTSVQWNTSSEIPPIKCTFFVVQLLSHVQLSVTPWTAACHASLSFTPCFPVLHCLWVFSDSCLLSQWCHATISSSAVPFSCLQSFPASGSFPMSQFLASGGQSIRASGSALWVRLCPLKRYVEILSLRSPVEDEPLLKAKQKAHIPCLPSLPQTQQPCSSFFRIPWGLFLC